MADRIVIDNSGAARFVFSDLAASVVSSLGTARTRRASNVEPGPDGKWYVDLSPSGGPILGPFEFSDKESALKAEIEWLNQQVI